MSEVFKKGEEKHKLLQKERRPSVFKEAAVGKDYSIIIRFCILIKKPGVT